MVVVDGCCGIGPERELLQTKKELMDIFASEDQGAMREYIGCKIDYGVEHRRMQITQPVLVQSFLDEFSTNQENYVATPGIPGQVLRSGDVDTGPSEQFNYRKGTGKLIHLQKWSRPDIINATRDLARFMGAPTTTHIKALERCMSYVVQSSKAAWYFVQMLVGMELQITNLLFWDASYRSCPETGRNVSGWSIFIHGASTNNKSNLQNWVTLSTTETELVSAASCAQSLLFHYKLLSDLGLHVKLPMLLEVDNKGAKDLTCNWSAGGRMRHVDIRQFFLRDLKEDNIVRTKWISTADNSADLFNKNLAGHLFAKHIRTYVGVDVFMNTEVVACLLGGLDAGVDYHRGESVGDRRKSSGSRTMTSGKISDVRKDFRS
jgi:hypothetical protein